MARSNSNLIVLIGVAVGGYLLYRYAQANCPGQTTGFCGLYNNIFGGGPAATAPAPQPTTPAPSSGGGAVVAPALPAPSGTFVPAPRVYVTSVNGAPAGTDAQHITTLASVPGGGHR